MKVSVMFLLVAVVLCLMLIGGVLLYGYVDSINHWSETGVKFLNLMIGLFLFLSLWVSFEAGIKGE
jgi:hypothetical protein